MKPFLASDILSIFSIVMALTVSTLKQCDQVVRGPDLKSGDLKLKSHSAHQLDLVTVVPG